jgi:hypothetical protein
VNNILCGFGKFTGSMILKFMSIQTSVEIHVAVCLRDMGIKGFIVDLNWLPVILSVDGHGNLSYVYLSHLRLHTGRTNFP